VRVRWNNAKDEKWKLDRGGAISRVTGRARKIGISQFYADKGGNGTKASEELAARIKHNWKKGGRKVIARTPYNSPKLTPFRKGH